MFLTTKKYYELETKYHSLLRWSNSEFAAKQREIERLELEYERLRQDFNAVVAMLGNQAQRPTSKTLTDDDLFKEQTDQLDTFLSPSPDDFLGGEEILTRLGDADRK